MPAGTLTASAKASAVGLGDTATIARTVTAIIQAYGEKNIDAARATEIMFKTVKDGNVEANEMAGTFGRVIGISSQLGVSFDQVGAYVATFTRLGVNSAEAVTALRGTLTAMIKPSKDAQETLGSVGLTFEQLRQEIREKGLTQAMLDLVGHFKGNEDALAKVIPNVRALAGVMGTAGAQADSLKEVQAHLTAQTDEMGAAFDTTTKTAKFGFSQLSAEAEKLAISLGDRLAPNFKVILDNAKPALESVISLVGKFGELPAGVQTAAFGFVAFVAAIGPVLVTVGGLAWSMSSVITLVGTELVAGTTIGGAAVTGFGALFSPVTLLVGGLTFAVWKVVDAFHGLDAAHAQGKSTWEFLTAKDDDTFLRRWLGLSSGVDKASKSLGDIALPTERAKTAVTGFIGPIQQATQAIKEHTEAVENDLNIFGGVTTINASVETSFQDLTFKVQNYGTSIDIMTTEARDYAMDRLFAEGAPYNAYEIAVVLAVVRHMNGITLEAWPAYPRLQRQTRLSTKTIQRVLRQHCEDSPAPLLARSFIGKRKSYTYHLVRDPERFAAARPPKRSRWQRSPAMPKLAAPLTGGPTITPSVRPAGPRRIKTGAGTGNYTIGDCRCGARVVTRAGVSRNYIDDAAHVCRFTTESQPEGTNSPVSERTNGPTKTSEIPLTPVNLEAMGAA